MSASANQVTSISNFLKTDNKYRENVLNRFIYLLRFDDGKRVLEIVKILSGEHSYSFCGKGSNVCDWIHVNNRSCVVWETLTGGRFGKVYPIVTNKKFEFR